LDDRDIIVDGATLTVNGAHTFKNLTLTNNATLTHSDTTTTDEYRLDVTVTNTLTIETGSGIDVTGKGYLGASSGGNSGNYGRTIGNTTTGGSNTISGGSYGGLGGKYSSYAVNAVYGSIYNPDELGSGGGSAGGVYRGGNGGGLARIVTNDIALNGRISANGGDGSSGRSGGGSGGGILISTGTLSGTGMISANGGNQTAASYTTGGGGGRIAVYYDDISNFGTAGDITGHITAYGGTGYNANGGAGAIYTRSSTQAYGDLMVNNNNTVTTGYSTPLASVGTGTSTDLTADTLTDDTRSWRTDDLAGIYLNPNTGQDSVMRVLNNDATTITIDLNDGDMTIVATTGDTYRGQQIFDTLDIRGLARVQTYDDIKVLTPNT
ncbi:MAG: hypothetical protein GY789_17630, partial [Hyphomicrobiales bacterium]|nr:hypothetical protein [Hyphomicrobiales bacterium]